MREKLNRFMGSRYGFDELSNVYVIIVLVCLVLSTLTGISIFMVIGMALLIYMYVRIFSKNIEKRRAENQKYLDFRYNLAKNRHNRQQQFAQRKEFKFFKCPHCKQTVRVPRGHGKICITCPKCSTEFIKKS